MRIPTPREAVAIQRELAGRVETKNRHAARLRTVGGTDMGLGGGRARAVIAVLSWPELEPLEIARATRPLEFPYIPGLLAFRELPALLDAYERLRQEPDFLLVDGHGIAHPRRFGIAAHLGVELDRPTIGCGKSRLVGTHRDPAARRGSSTRLMDKGECIGRVLRTRDGVRPVYVSVGHRFELQTACKLVLRAASRYRLPEPIRVADHEAGRVGARR